MPDQFNLVTTDVAGAFGGGLNLGRQFRASQLERKQEEFLQGGLEQPNAVQNAAKLGLDFQAKVAKGLGLQDERTLQINQQGLTEAADFSFKIQSLPLDQQNIAINERVVQLEAAGRDATQTRELLNIPQENRAQALAAVQLAALPNDQRLTLMRGVQAGTGEREFNALIADMSPEDQIRAKEIKAGLTQRATAPQIVDVGGVPHIFDKVQGKLIPAEVGGAPVTTDTIAKSESTIIEAGELAKGRAGLTTKTINAGFDSISNIDKNMRNLDRAISALERGAGVGAVESFFPSIKAASVELDNIQSELALDVVGAVTFGALSKGELDLAKSVALPTGLDTAELLVFLNDKKTAQSKLRDYFSEQIDFLDAGGSVPEFLAQKQGETGEQGMTDNGDGTFTLSDGRVVRRTGG